MRGLYPSVYLNSSLRQSRICQTRRLPRARRQLPASRQQRRCPFPSRPRLCRNREVRRRATKSSVQGRVKIEIKWVKWAPSRKIDLVQELGEISGVPRLGAPRLSPDRVEETPAALSVLWRRLVYPPRVRRGCDGASGGGKGAESHRPRLQALQALSTPQGTSSGIQGQSGRIYENCTRLSDGNLRFNLYHQWYRARIVNVSVTNTY